MRQEPVAPGLGFEAMIASRFGRDAMGIGGGAPAAVVEVGDGLDVGTGGGVSVDLFKAKERAEGLGGGGNARLGGSLSGVFDSDRAGSAGREGSWGGSALAETAIFDLDLIAFMIVLPCCCCSSGAFFAGRGGSFVGSYAGARISKRCPPFEVPLLMPVTAEPRDRDDTAEETVEIDSIDAFRPGVRSAGNEGVRGGRLGGLELFRGGGRGGSAGDLFGSAGGAGAG